MMITMKLFCQSSLHRLLLISYLFISLNASAQNSGYLELLGRVQQDGKSLEGASIRIFKGNEPIDEVITSSGGRFILNLDFNHLYTLVFSKRGAVTKAILVDTKVPLENQSIIFSYEFKIDLFKIAEDEIQQALPDKPVARISYDPRFDDFNHDVKYTEARKEEFQQIKKDQAAILAKQRQDSIEAAKAEARARAIALAMEKAREDSLRKAEAAERARQAAIQKAYQDSIQKVAAAARAEQARLEKLRQDSIARAQAEERARLAALEKARQDSIQEAKRQAEIRARFVADSIARAQAEEKARLAALEKARQDSLARAKAEEEARARFIADSIRKAEEEARLAALEKAKQKALADAEEKRKREIEAQKEALARVTRPEIKQPQKIELPELKRDYPEGISEETITESNRVLYRTVIKRSITQDVFYKIVYNWGGIFYFKNGQSMSEANYNTEINNIKAALKQ